MTYLNGTLVLESGKHRLFNQFSTLLIVVESIAKAFTVTARQPLDWKPGDHADFECAQFPLEVHLPLWGSIEATLKGIELGTIEIGIFSTASKSPGSTADLVRIRHRLFCDLITPGFTELYEDAVPWLLANVNGDRSLWPEPWNFARLVRNAISHGGTLNLDNPNAVTGSWHHLTYGPAQNKKQIIGTELLFPDILILMLEMSDKLDQLGCPI